MSSPTLSTELTSVPERHPFRLEHCEHSPRFYVGDLYVQRSDVQLHHPAPHYAPALLLLIESIVFRLAVALTGTAKSAKSRRAWCSAGRSLGIGDRGDIGTTMKWSRIIEREMRSAGVGRPEEIVKHYYMSFLRIDHAFKRWFKRLRIIMSYDRRG